MIEINNITKRYGDFTAITNISITIDKGTIYGLAGYNGAGKTTLLTTMCGALKPDEGSVSLDGQFVHNNSFIKSKLFLVSDEPYQFTKVNMKQMAKFYKGYYPKWDEPLFIKLVAIFKLDITKRMSSFSKGMYRQAFIIFALCVGADYLLLDEAFDGIDPMMRDVVRHLIIETVAERGTSVIVSSHNLRELENLCERIAILNGKRIAYDAKIEDMRNSIHKFRVCFNESQADQALLIKMGIQAKQVKTDGKNMVFVANGLVNEIKQKLAECSLTLLETIPLSLDEMFMVEMEADTYDFKDLFKKNS